MQQGQVVVEGSAYEKGAAASGEMTANAIFPRYGYDTILQKLDNAGRLASLEDRLMAYFQTCGIESIKPENNVLVWVSTQ